MGGELDGIDSKLRAWISRQRLFFVATAPNGPGGHVNVSPKGQDTLRVLDTRRVAYLDLTGSGVETIAHVRENGRVTIMLCAFQGPPRIVRLHGRGRVMQPADPDFPAWRARFGEHDGVRSVIVVEVERVSDSCGYGVPLMDHAGDRPQMQAWFARKGPEGLVEYRRRHARSIDGLPAEVAE